MMAFDPDPAPILDDLNARIAALEAWLAKLEGSTVDRRGQAEINTIYQKLMGHDAAV